MASTAERGRNLCLLTRPWVNFSFRYGKSGIQPAIAAHLSKTQDPVKPKRYFLDLLDITGVFSRKIPPVRASAGKFALAAQKHPWHNNLNFGKFRSPSVFRKSLRGLPFSEKLLSNRMKKWGSEIELMAFKV
jgi:hypothetical protein